VSAGRAATPRPAMHRMGERPSGWEAEHFIDTFLFFFFLDGGRQQNGPMQHQPQGPSSATALYAGVVAEKQVRKKEFVGMPDPFCWPKTDVSATMCAEQHGKHKAYSNSEKRSVR